jgi:hypothetical protein
MNAPTAVHGFLGNEDSPPETSNTIADRLGNQFTPIDLCEENHVRRVEAEVQALLESVENSPHDGMRSYDVQKKGLRNFLPAK